jgi:hypothetical protein
MHLRGSAAGVAKVYKFIDVAGSILVWGTLQSQLLFESVLMCLEEPHVNLAA